MKTTKILTCFTEYGKITNLSDFGGKWRDSWGANLAAVMLMPARLILLHSESTRSTCSLNQWVRSLVGLITSAGTGEYFPPLQSACRNCGGGDRGRVAIYRPFGEFRRAKSYCHLYGAQGQRQAYLLPMPR
ncbi:hypothetical protein TNCV_1110431 [Trichonephila clavipes]|nr:hypothetical protein TNCV_1110431 [Trichonephila clavipes]